MERLRRIVSISALVILAASLSFAQSDSFTLTAPLTGANERPNPGDIDGTGFAVVRIEPSANTIYYWVLAANINTPTAAHIHRAGADVPGPVVVTFNPTFTNGATSGSVTADPALIAEILANPAGFYVNVHNADFPGGAIRAQLSPQEDLRSAVLFATLNGANERPTPGDADGTGFAVVRFDRNVPNVRYSIVTTNVPGPTAAHIHRGTSDIAGGVVVNFAPTFVEGAASGAVASTPSLIDEILANPSGFYVNVHNAEFPGGAVRGQLMVASAAAEELVIPIVGRTAGANGTFYRTNLSVLNLTPNSAPVLLEYFSSATVGNASPTSTAMVVLGGNEQLSLNGDALQRTLNLGDGTGALRITSPVAVAANANVFNDQRSVGRGTFGQLVPAFTASDALWDGVLPMLSDQRSISHAGSRTNIGWFNGSGSTTTIVFTARRPNGTALATSTQTVLVGAQRQLPLEVLFPSLESLDQMYVTFTTTGGPLYVYASVVDNDSGDAIFVPAR
ncbi:MAG: CHRD domain-containing protein [Thermoanaerobaculia bacterium]